MRTVPTIVALALLAPVLAAAKPNPTSPVYVATGKQTSCVQERDLDTIVPLTPTALLFKMKGGGSYRSDLDSKCDYDPDWDVIVHQSPTTSFCSGEVLQLQHRDLPGVFKGACIIGPFTPVKRAPAQP